MLNLLPAETIKPNTVHCMDVMSFLNALASGSVDLIFADSPYNLGYAYDKHHDRMADAEYEAWCQRWLTECTRVLSPTGSLFLLHLPKWAKRLGTFLDNYLIFQHWIAWKAATRSGNRPLMPEHYALLYYTKSDTFTVNEVRYPHKRCRSCGELIADYGGKKHLIHPYGPKISDVWTDIGRAKHEQRGEHPCKLPEKLVKRVISFASNPGDLVMDPFIGAGTTAVVAQRMGRDYIGCDISPAYIQMTDRALAIPYTLPMFAALEQVDTCLVS